MLVYNIENDACWSLTVICGRGGKVWGRKDYLSSKVLVKGDRKGLVKNILIQK